VVTTQYPRHPFECPVPSVSTSCFLLPDPPALFSLKVTPTGNGIFNVNQARVGTQEPRGNRVTLDLPSGVMDCTCAFTRRFCIPCSDVIAVGKGKQYAVVVEAMKHERNRRRAFLGVLVSSCLRGALIHKAKVNVLLKTSKVECFTFQRGVGDQQTLTWLLFTGMHDLLTLRI